ncbi:ATP-binding protein [Solidesulfovibrio alcoholivorans]|uniref:ATP-binding protein n=1 Tax=Solidesulfovibrio alcoholivorans TaxID=81406 RepID=UPI000B1C74FC|nr:ATP-binding protein [Solidesulfovibrio alcoholivorans]
MMMQRKHIGYVSAIEGAEVTLVLDAAVAGEVRVGEMVVLPSPRSMVFGLVQSLTIPAPAASPGENDRHLARLALLGESLGPERDDFIFTRGVSVSPCLGGAAQLAATGDLARIYAKPTKSSVRIGSLHQDPEVPAFMVVDDFLGKHFAVLGTTGSGKSCTVAVLLRSVLAAHGNGHIVLLDPHDEYAAAFGDMAESVTPDNLVLPYWLLDFEEMVQVFCSGGQPYREVEANILKECVLAAKAEYWRGAGGDEGGLTIDTPTPYRLARVTELLKTGMGRLDKPESAIPYLRLTARLDALRRDRRFSFMFGQLTIEDNMGMVLARYLRLPADGRPLTIFNLAGVPAEIVDVVVSVLCRLIFDFALWAERGRGRPVLLVCEEAHRYVPRDASAAFGPTRRALARIAKEGRKYGVSLGLVTQRPSEISETVLSQVNTLVSLRMSNEQDQLFVRRAMPENAAGLLSALPALRTQEAVVVGEGVPVPMRIHMRELAANERPRSDTACFSAAWAEPCNDKGFIDDTIDRWRRQVR